MLLAGCSADRPAPVSSLSSNKPLARVVNYEPIKGNSYRVKKGDTLYSIAFRSGQDYRQLAKRNGIAAPYRIFPGQIIRLSWTAPKVAKKPPTSSGPSTQSRSPKKVEQKTTRAYGQSKGNKNVNSQPAVGSSVTRQWRWPVQGKLIAGFSHRQDGNKGIDISAPRGTPVRATAAGKVVYAGSALRGYGRLVIIKHDDDYLSAYAHNDSLQVKEQQWVKAGQIIARVGDSDSETVKLHFEIRYRGTAINPLKKLKK
ncbi:peptidoglycan DD-metalloendopeptidase family protein [Gallaecimonas sp. GXIMD4217]|uniref:peptidoglycan DD-metalloendopeptidase family protein n=1 Tax=Gallaecimonas sp. GXIMD4217 TaxID=3131927 RepID=UPI00311AE972